MQLTYSINAPWNYVDGALKHGALTNLAGWSGDWRMAVQRIEDQVWMVTFNNQAEGVALGLRFDPTEAGSTAVTVNANPLGYGMDAESIRRTVGIIVSAVDNFACEMLRLNRAAGHEI